MTSKQYYQVIEKLKTIQDKIEIERFEKDNKKNKYHALEGAKRDVANALNELDIESDYVLNRIDRDDIREFLIITSGISKILSPVKSNMELIKRVFMCTEDEVKIIIYSTLFENGELEVIRDIYRNDFNDDITRKILEGFGVNFVK
jgi:hypothetical protein